METCFFSVLLDFYYFLHCLIRENSKYCKSLQILILNLLKSTYKIRLNKCSKQYCSSYFIVILF